MKLSPLLVVLAACHHAPPPAEPHAAAVDSLVGVWAGNAIATPFGDFPFAIAFDRQRDGSVHGRLDNSRGMYLDFTFTAGTLVEQGAIPGVGVQTHTLQPAGGTHWADAELDVDLAIAGDALKMTTRVRGTPHAVFELHRSRGAEADQIRERIAKRTK